jgi:histidine kinase
MATLGEMATGVAHELNQPLSVIKTASSFFMKKINKNEKIEDEILLTMSEEIDGHVDRATKIINRMRQFGRKSDMTFEQVQLNDVLRSAFEIFSQQLKVRGIEVLWEIEENLPMIMADPSRLEQVFINLLLNARDSIEEKWGAKKHEHDGMKIMLKTRIEGENVVAEVSDTGKGIPNDILDKVFEPFFTTKSAGEGTGLGLSISYGIIKDCGGGIKIKTEEGKGASFIITFPLPDEE